MNKALGVVLLAFGIALIAYGFNAPDPMSQQASQTFTGDPTGRFLWLLLGGSAAVIVGEAMIFHRSTKATTNSVTPP